MTEKTEKFTTPGAIKLKHSMPTEATKQSYDLYRPLDKGGVSKVVASLLKDGGPGGIPKINDLGKLFFNKATEIGASTPLSDYINESDERQAIIKEFDHLATQIMISDASKADKNNQLAELTGKYNKKIEDQNVDYLISRGSVAAKMAKTGARGNKSQLATGTSTPLMSINMSGAMIPIVIEHSFAQGMSPAEHLALSYMGRGSTVMSQLSTSLPGALFKKLSPTVFHEVITVSDCGTHNGIMVPIDDRKNLVGRFLAGLNTLIDEKEYKDLKNDGHTSLKVRSTMTCEAKEGVCQKCFGLMANGKLPEIGTNVGVIAAQSVSEILTQAMLSTKHKATVGERKGNPYIWAANLLNNPSENFKDEATISTSNGKVTAITKSELGDTHVYVDNVPHFVPIDQKLHVQVGDKVKIGQPLSTGTINPRKLVDLRGLGAGRQYMAEELRNIYGGDLDPRHFELISKNLLKYVEVKDPGNTDLLTGDIVDINSIRPQLEDKAGETPVDKAEGGVLAKGILSLTPGTYLDFNHIQDLKDQGIHSVYLVGNGLKVTPKVPGLQTAKMLDKNWVSKLSFSRLRDTLREGASVGATSAIHSTDPIASYMMGNEFGEGQNGKY